MLQRLFSIFLSVFFVLALAIATSPTAYACDGYDIATVGNVWIDTDQYQELVTEIIGCSNYVNTTDFGYQSIQGGGIGDALTYVSAEGYSGQEGPYDTGQIAVPHGTVLHTGGSAMEITGGAGTDAFCHEFNMEISTNRKSDTYNEIGAGHMDSSLCSCADFSADISGATGTTNFGVNVHAIDAYSSEAIDGRLQTGRTEVKISGGNFD